MSDTLTKDGILDDITAGTAMDRKAASEGLEQVLDIIKETLARGEHVSFSGFGKWEVRQKKARWGRNPRSGEETLIAARKVVSFSLSNALRAKLEEKR